MAHWGHEKKRLSWSRDKLSQDFEKTEVLSFSRDNAVTNMAEAVLDQRIWFYFDQGLTQLEIPLCISIIDGLHISVHHLRRQLARLGLYRRKHRSDPETVASFITTQLQGSGQLHGYRFMHERWRLAGLHVSRSLINQILSSLDPEGVLRRRLIRRRYNGKGPNFLWHLDCYDKWNRYQWMHWWVFKVHHLDGGVCDK